MERFSIDSYEQGYHVYNDTWEASVGEELPYQCEDGNTAYPYAVAIKTSFISLFTSDRMFGATVQAKGLLGSRTPSAAIKKHLCHSRLFLLACI